MTLKIPLKLGSDFDYVFSYHEDINQGDEILNIIKIQTINENRVVTSAIAKSANDERVIMRTENKKLIERLKQQDMLIEELLFSIIISLIENQGGM